MSNLAPSRGVLAGGDTFASVASTVLDAATSDANGPVNPTFMQRFALQAALTPYAPAVCCDGRRLTYRELDQQAGKIAAELMQRGVRAGELVAVAVPRSLDLVAAMVGVLKAGAAFVPIDHTHPPVRIAYVLQDCGAKIAVTTPELRAKVPTRDAVCVHLASAAEVAAGAAAFGPGDDPDRPAYVMYTSGSTGKPKGVVVPHGALATFVAAVEGRPWFALGARIIAVTTTSFDISILELLVGLCFGAEVIVATDRDVADPARLRALVASYAPACVQATPSHWNTLLGGGTAWLASNTVLVGGEPLRRDLARKLRQAAVAVFNLYGPTEATIWASCRQVDTDDCDSTDGPFVTIGRPLPGYQLRVMGDGGRPAEIGETGELYIGGGALAAGYLNRPELTAERFIHDGCPPEPRQRMYRTGDLVRVGADGALHFLGRTDDQVKVRGFRIELGEVEAVLRSHPDVDDAVAAVRSDLQQLVAYVVPALRDQEVRDRSVGQWRDVWDATYRASRVGDVDFNTAGWNSSLTGKPIAPQEMRAWADEIVSRIRPLGAKRIVDVGCGTGLLLGDLAPDCNEYTGIDIATSALGHCSHLINTHGWEHVRLQVGEANDLSLLSDASADLVILNSVVQYFPNLPYFLDGLAEALRVVRDGGHVFIGDLRSLPLLEAYHGVVQMHQAQASLPVAELRRLVRAALVMDKELLLDPELFTELAASWPRVAAATTMLKTAGPDELRMFRYDVLLEVGGARARAQDAQHVVPWDPNGGWQSLVSEYLRDKSASVAVGPVKVGAVASAIEAVRLLSTDEANGRDVEWLRAAAAAATGQGTAEMMQFASSHGASILLRRFERDGTYEALFNAQWQPAPDLATARSHYVGFANTPARPRSGALLQHVHAHAKLTLPSYMVPDVIVEIESIPLTANGKVDRKALPNPVGRGTTAYQPPQTPAEEALCRIFAEVVGVLRVGVDDNFFSLGGHSLMAMQLADHVRTEFGVEASMQMLFQAPTVRQLSAFVTSGIVPHGNGRSSRVIVLREGVSHPLFCLPPIYGLGFAYAGLLRELSPDLPVYCLQASGFEDGEPMLESMEAIAADYISLIREIQPHGPYHLFGWSIGGLLAHEVGCTLQAAGEEVAVLALVDSYPPSEERRRSRGTNFNVVELIREHVTDGVQDKTPEQVERVMQVALNYGKFLGTFTPKTFAGDMLLICASANRRWARLWRPFVTGDLNARAVACGHIQMMTLEYIGQIAAMVEQQIRRQ